MQELTTEQLALVNAPVETAAAAPVAAAEKKSRVRPAVQQRLAQTREAVKTVLSDCKSRGVSEITRNVAELGLIGAHVWSDVYNVLKNDATGTFNRYSIEGAKREKWGLRLVEVALAEAA